MSSPNEPARLLEFMKKLHPDSVRIAIEQYKKDAPSSEPTLPREVWKLIFSYLPEKHAKTAGLVSKSWKSMTDQERYRRADLSDYSQGTELSGEEIQQRLERVPPESRSFLQELNLYGSKVDDATLRWIFQNFPRLKVLNLGYTLVRGSAFLPPREGEKSLPELEKLIFYPLEDEEEENLVNFDLILDYLRHNPQLKSYDFGAFPLSIDEKKELLKILLGTSKHLEEFLYSDENDSELRNLAVQLIQSKSTLTSLTLDVRSTNPNAALPLFHALGQNTLNQLSLNIKELSLNRDVAHGLNLLLEANKISKLEVSLPQDQATLEILADGLSRTSKLRSLESHGEATNFFRQVNQKLTRSPKAAGTLDLEELYFDRLETPESFQVLAQFLLHFPKLRVLNVLHLERLPQNSELSRVLRSVPHLRYLQGVKINPDILENHPQLESLEITKEEFTEIQKALVEKASQLKTLSIWGGHQTPETHKQVLKLIRDHPHLENLRMDTSFSQKEWIEIAVALSHQPRFISVLSDDDPKDRLEIRTIDPRIVFVRDLDLLSP